MGYLRLWLALAVVFAHAGLGGILLSSQVAVQTFFLISGFLISFILTRDEAYADYLRFYVSRFLRIFPAYWAVLLLTLGLRLIEGERLAEFLSLPASTQVSLITVNLSIFLQDAIFFTRLDGPILTFTPDYRPTDPQIWTFLLLPQTWALSLELVFYASAPFLIRSRKALWAVLIGSLAVRAGLTLNGLDHDPWTYRFLPAEMGLFAAGALAHQIVLPMIRRGDVGAITGALAAMILALPLLPVGAIVFLPLMALALPYLFLTRWPHDRFAGDIAFPLYLIHWPVWLVAKEAGAAIGSPPAVTALATVAASLVAAAALYWTVIAPIDRVRARLRQAPVTPKVFQVPAAPAAG